MRSRGILTVGLAFLALCSVGVASANDAPLAEAGLDQAAAVNTTVYLDAGGSVDPDGTIDQYRWSIAAPDGSEQTPDCETCPTTWFVPSQEGQYNVTIQVVDDSGVTSEDTLYVNAEGWPSPVSGEPSEGPSGPGGSTGGSGGGPSLSGGPGGCPGCGGSTGSNEAILVNDGGETMISAGIIEPWDTVEIQVANAENLEINGEEFNEVADSPGEAPLNEFTAEMSELGISPTDVENSMTANSIEFNHESTSQIVSQTLDSRMESINSNFENSALSGLQTVNHDSDTDTPTDDSLGDSRSSEANPRENDETADTDISYNSGSPLDSNSASDDDIESPRDDSSLDGLIGPVGPHP